MRLEQTREEKTPAGPPPESSVPAGFTPRTALVRELLALSEQAKADGLAPCDQEEILAEIAARRAGR